MIEYGIVVIQCGIGKTKISLDLFENDAIIATLLTKVSEHKKKRKYRLTRITKESIIVYKLAIHINV